MDATMLTRVIDLEYRALLLAGPPLLSAACAGGLRLLAARRRDKGAAAWAARLVAWAEQAVPARSGRYAAVAALLSRRFPVLSGEQIEVLIESEVLALKKAVREATPALGGPAIPPRAAASPETPPAVPTVPASTQGLRLGGVPTGAGAS